MLEAAWENHATLLANAPTTDEFLKVLENFIKTAKIDLAKPSRVIYARDTRPSGDSLVKALEDGLKVFGAERRDAGVTTTPILHYLVKATNTKGTPYSYGEPSEEGYYRKLGDAFQKLMACSPLSNPYIVLSDAIDAGGKTKGTAPPYRLCKWRRRDCCGETLAIHRRKVDLCA